jgi:hypothetical protein
MGTSLGVGTHNPEIGDTWESIDDAKTLSPTYLPVYRFDNDQNDTLHVSEMMAVIIHNIFNHLNLIVSSTYKDVDGLIAGKALVDGMQSMLSLQHNSNRKVSYELTTHAHAPDGHTLVIMLLDKPWNTVNGYTEYLSLHNNNHVIFMEKLAGQKSNHTAFVNCLVQKYFESRPVIPPSSATHVVHPSPVSRCILDAHKLWQTRWEFLLTSPQVWKWPEDPKALELANTEAFISNLPQHASPNEHVGQHEGRHRGKTCRIIQVVPMEVEHAIVTMARTSRDSFENENLPPTYGLRPAMKVWFSMPKDLEGTVAMTTTATTFTGTSHSFSTEKYSFKQYSNDGDIQTEINRHLKEQRTTWNGVTIDLIVETCTYKYVSEDPDNSTNDIFEFVFYPCRFFLNTKGEDQIEGRQGEDQFEATHSQLFLKVVPPGFDPIEVIEKPWNTVNGYTDQVEAIKKRLDNIEEVERDATVINTLMAIRKHTQ